MIARKMSNGDYYICRKSVNGCGPITETTKLKNIFTIIQYSKGAAVYTGKIAFPMNLLGKKFRLKVEFIDDEIKW